MEIYLVRHGDAEPADAPGVACDADRALTPGGKKDLLKIISGLRKVVEPPDIILTSPLVRARETAEIVRSIFDLSKSTIQVENDLGAGASPNTIIQVARKTSKKRVFLVGHEPDFSHCVAWMASGQAGEGVVMKKGGIARIDIDEKKSGLVWLLPPKVAKALDR